MVSLFLIKHKKTNTDMKKTVILLTALLTATALNAQTTEGTVTVRARQDLVKILPENIVYLLPEFSEGTVDFTDGTSNPGTVNICNLDNSVRFIHSSGDTLLLANNNKVSRVIVNGTVYTKTEGIFLKQAAVYGSLSICERRQLSIDETQPDAGYSGIPATSMAKSSKMSQVDYDRMETGQRDLKYRLKTDVVLTDGKEIYQSRMSTFNKLFPEAKKQIKTFVKENKTDFQNLESATALFMYCAGL